MRAATTTTTYEESSHNKTPSRRKAQSKAKLIFAILDEMKNSGPNISNPESKLHKMLQGLAALESKYVSSRYSHDALLMKLVKGRRLRYL